MLDARSSCRRLSDEIGQKQAEFDRQVYRHFDGIKAVLHPDQYPRLHKLIMDALDKKLPAIGGTDDERPSRPGDREGRRDDRRPPRDDHRPPRLDEESRGSGR